MRTVFQDEGDLRATDVLAGLVTLWREGASGALHFSRSGASAGFHLVAGELSSVSSSESRFETASILLRAGKLDAATLERLSTPAGGDRALSALHAGVLTKREWRWGEKIRAVEVLSDLLTWIEGDYVFDRDSRLEPGEFRLTVPRLVLELFLRSRDRGLVLHYLGGADVPLARAAHFDSEFTAFGLTADAEAVVRLIDGKATAAQIASEGPAEPFAVEKLLAALVTLGLVHPEFVAAETSSATDGARRLEPEPEEEEPQEREDETGGLEISAGMPERSEREPSLHARDADDSGQGERFEEAELSGVRDHAMRGAESRDEEPEIGASGPEIGGEIDSPLERAAYDLGGRPADREPEASSEDMVDIGPARESPPMFERPLDMTTGVGSIDRPRARSSGPLLWLLAVLAASVAAVILLRGRGASSRPMAPAQTETPTIAAAAATVTPSGDSRSGTAVPAAALPTGAPTRPYPTRTLAAPTRVPLRTASPAPAATRGGNVAPAQPAPGTREAWLERATRDRQRAGADRKSRFTIQLELACEISSLADAWKYDHPSGTLWVLATPFQGKTCFRVLWGRYPTREAARRALSGIPPFFSTPRNRPSVTAIR